MTHKRDLTSSEWFHIVQKGADGQDIFGAASHRAVYEEFLADALVRFEVDLHAYAWMTNHTHMLAHAPMGGLPEAMHLLGSRYASVYNGWTDRSGPLFTARYFSEPITADAQLIQCARYIHRNPLPITGSSRLADYQWSSLGALCNRRSAPTWLATGVVMADFDPMSYARYVVTPQPTDRIGSAWMPPSTPTDCVEIETAVASVVGRPLDDLRSPVVRGADDARTLMIALAVDFRAATPAELATRYGLSDQRSVRRIARRGRARASESVAFRHLRERVIARLDVPVGTLAPVPGDPGSGDRGVPGDPGSGDRGGWRQAG